MSYLKFDKAQLINLEYSLGIEFLHSNRAGAFASSTIINCNTRKYHGMFICHLEDLDDGFHLLLSAVDETIIQHDKEFHLAVRKYPGKFHPGHKYIMDFSADPIPAITYRVGGVVLKKERLLVENEPTILIKYTLEDCHSDTKIRLHPFLAFRNVHMLTHANMVANTRVETVKNGVRSKMYEGYPYLYMQTSKKSEWVPAPMWFNDIEYLKEKERGYEYKEDSFVPGFFELSMKKGESVIFAGGLEEITPSSLTKKFDSEVSKRVPRNSFENCLENSAQQFFYRDGKKTRIIAGFPWFGAWTRDTFIALPGLTLARGDVDACKTVLDTMIEDAGDNPFFKDIFAQSGAQLNNMDSSLWFFWTLQQYAQATSKKTVWKQYGEKMKTILNTFKQGTDYNVKMHENGLLFGGADGVALTWMDAVIDKNPVTPRKGYPVEVNALWYNAICFALELAKENKDKEFIAAWETIPAVIEKSFLEVFYDSSKRYLADYVDGWFKDWSVRPNQIFAASLPYSPLPEEIRKEVVDCVEQELLTPRGLRTLSPKDKDYIGNASGDITSKDRAYHQGTAWPWLLGHFADAYLKLYEKSGVSLIKKLYNGFEAEMNRHGIGSISEIYDGNPPQTPRGAISQAWSVAEIIRLKKIYEKYE